MNTKRVCVLIIHGMGEQKKYDTLDIFTRHLAIALQGQFEKGLKLSHKMMRVDGTLDDTIRLFCDSDPALQVDTHEFYWAHETERKISFGETIGWLIKAADGAKKFYDDNQEFAKKYEAFENGRFKKRWYLREVGWLLRAVYGFEKITGRALPGFVDPVIRLFMGKTTRTFADYMGDVAIYANTDMKSKHFPVRKKVLEGTITQIISYMQSKEYDQIIILGHSLGSVIAYDALNELNIRMNVDPKLEQLGRKITAMITFGSPLDKTAFFLREHVKENECVKRLIFNNKNCFRWRDIEDFDFAGIKATSEVKNMMPHIRWFNYWDQNDPVSGNLDFYKDIENHRIDNGMKWGIAHTGYWHNLDMYQNLVQKAQIFNLDVPNPPVETNPIQPQPGVMTSNELNAPVSRSVISQLALQNQLPTNTYEQVNNSGNSTSGDYGYASSGGDQQQQQQQQQPQESTQSPFNQEDRYVH